MHLPNETSVTTLNAVTVNVWLWLEIILNKPRRLDFADGEGRAAVGAEAVDGFGGEYVGPGVGEGFGWGGGEFGHHLEVVGVLAALAVVPVDAFECEAPGVP